MEKEKNKDKIVKDKARELIRRHKKYIGEEVAKKAIDKLEENTEEKEMQKDEIKEETENVNVQEKGKRGRPRRKA